MEKIRLQKFLAQAGVASRRQAEELIKAGRIKVNHQTVTDMGILINPHTDIVEFQDKIIKPNQNIYYLLNKPKGYTSTCYDPHAKQTVLQLLPSEPRVFPVGRLDKDSRGLLILTNDGNIANLLTHPRYQHEKEYSVTAHLTAAVFQPDETIIKKLHQLEKGVFLDGKPTAPAQISAISLNLAQKTVKFNIILREGRNRQIRRMCDMIELKVVDLQRVRIGNLKIDNLKEGQYRIISKTDIIPEPK